MTTTPTAPDDTPQDTDWERLSRQTAGRVAQIFPALDTVTVNGLDIEIGEEWAREEFAGLLLSGHHDTPTALAAARAYLDAHHDDLLDAAPHHETVYWTTPTAVSHRHLRWFLYDDGEVWNWTGYPTSRDLPVTVFTPFP